MKYTLIISLATPRDSFFIRIYVIYTAQIVHYQNFLHDISPSNLLPPLPPICLSITLPAPLALVLPPKPHISLTLPAPLVAVFLLLRPENLLQHDGAQHGGNDEEPDEDEQACEDAAEYRDGSVVA